LDFFTVPTATFRVLFVLVMLTQGRRPLMHVNVTEHPTADWTARHGALSRVAAVTDPAGIIHLFGINSAGVLFHRQQTVHNTTDPSMGGSWTGWDPVQSPGSLTSIAATVDLGGRVNIFGLTNGDQLFQRVKLGDVYTGWSQIPGSMHNVAAIKEGGGQSVLVLIGLDANGNIYRNTSYGLIELTPNGPMPASWSGWVPLPRPQIRPTRPMLFN